ncbi:XRE family transcriptional regulator (plasmid) [Apilactobacillus apisilvae]|uniref:XRE family transcriptional regulator n=1 Tax=Apilactobacillus apisilvae TaxID=2923364 RepID=A0ABY4PKB6_9LACO|nr:XRE family transcriptional regulator [Apilactobacillus apisilvae]UQS85839.1 XRE family transcriptional regulator [Apilactobacillus apisilvae]
MKVKTDKKSLKENLVIPKMNLRKARLANEFTIESFADYIGVDRRQYELKEKGVYPFKDYEMIVLSSVLNKSVQSLFFDKNF